MMAYSPKYPLSPVSYHMAVVLLTLTRNAGGPVGLRLNLVDELWSDIASKLDGIKSEAARKEVSDVLNAQLKQIIYLRENYESAIDLSPYTFGKRGEFEKELSKIRTELVSLIENHGLVDKADMAEATMTSPIQRKTQ
ncbi:hypothetical protein RJ40_02340 [Methanofollis aquaemaris]|uniref:Uncharacterized protein n=1 Tax=Methanofollis aquaemaris TaxID=126734 RepID=A0A8A3S454_9EURY|nr:hypothetical protein [Methanofollis aquaemaris]QSZ66416.1 hypothetical protein RJ40_02340 [Methanofollis aquaemaris]